MKKRVACLLLCGLMTLNYLPVQARTIVSDVTFTVGGMRLMGESDAINIDGKNYLPLRAIFEMLGAQVDWNEYKNEARVVLDDMRIVINGDDLTAKLNDEGIDLDIQRIDGKIYLPVRLMGETLGFKVKWDQETRSVDISKPDSEYLLLDTASSVDEGVRVLTFEEAKKLAEKESSKLKNISDSVDYMHDARNTLGQTLVALDNVQGTLDSLVNTIEDADAALSVQSQLQENITNLVSVARSIKNIDVQQGLTKVNEQLVKDGIEIALISQVNAIKGTEISIQMLEQSIAVGAEGLENTKLKNSLGYASDVDVKKAELSQEELEKNLDLLYESLQTQKEALNLTLGLDAGEKVYVELDMQVNDLSDFKLEPYITKQRESAPSIKVLEGNVAIADYAKRTSAALVNESNKSVRNDLNTAKRALNDSKDTLEKNIRSTYHQLQQLALKDKQLKLAVEEAITDYNSAVVSYNAGMATAFTVKQARLGVLNAEKAVDDNKRSYIMLYATFEKPYLIQ